MLRNIHYIGKVKYNFRKTIEVVENGEIKKKRLANNVEEYLIYEGRHEGIVPLELFEKVQDRLGRNHRATTRVKLRNPLAGLVFCRNCGKTIVLQNSKKKEPARMVCTKQSRCGTGSCTYEDILERVCSILEQCIEDFEIRIKADTGDSIKFHNELIKNLEQKMKDLQAQELEQWKAQTHHDPSRRMPQEIFQQLNEKLLHEKEEVQQALCKAKGSMPEPIDYEERVARFRNALETLKDPEADVVLKNELLKACIERIEYHRDKPQRISLKGKGTFPLTAPKWTNPPIELDVKLKV